MDEDDEYLDLEDDCVVEIRNVQPLTVLDLLEVAARLAADISDSYGNAFRRLATYTAAAREWRVERTMFHEAASLEIESLTSDSE